MLFVDVFRITPLSAKNKGQKLQTQPGGMGSLLPLLQEKKELGSVHEDKQHLEGEYMKQEE